MKTNHPPDDLSFMDCLREYLHKGTWLPESFKESCGISLISAVVGRNVRYSYSLRDYYPNLYLLLVGESKCGKGIAIDDMIAKMLRKVAPEYLMAKQYTAESLARSLGEHPQGIVCNDEAANLISGKKYMEGMTTLLTSLFHCPSSYKISLIKEERDIQNPYLCLALGVQPEILGDLANKKRLIKSGFLARFLMIAGEKLPPRDDAVRKRRLEVQARKRLSALKGLLELIGPVNLEISSEGLRLIRRYGRALENKYEKEIESFFSRTRDLLIKLSMIYHLNEITRIIDLSERNEAEKKEVSQKSSPVNCQALNKEKLPDSEAVSFFSKDDDSDRKKLLFVPEKAVSSQRDLKLPLPKKSDKTLISAWKTLIKTPISTKAVSSSIDFLKSSQTGRVSLYRTMATSRDTRRLEKVSRAIDRMIDDEKCELHDDVRCILRRDLMRAVGMKLGRIKWVLTQLQEEGVIGEMFKAGKKILYPYLKDQTEARQRKKTKRMERRAKNFYVEIKEIEAFASRQFYCGELETWATDNGKMSRSTFFRVRKVMERMGLIKEVQNPPGTNKSKKYYKIKRKEGGQG